MSRGKFLGPATTRDLGNINKERRVCKLKYGCEETLWYGNREEVCRRKPSACRETRTYVRRIKRYMDE